MIPTYADLVGSPLPGLINPRALRGRVKSDGEIAAAALRAAHTAHIAAPAPAERMVRGLDSWSVWALEALDAPARGTGKNGAWTKADFEGLVV